MPEPKDKIKKDQPEKKETKTVKELKPEVKSDRLSAGDRSELLEITRADIEHGEKVQLDYIAQKELDLKHYNMAKPSELENLNKRGWQTDRNVGIGRAVADSYQATLLATSWNPDSINFVANTASDIDNRANQEKFTKWGMGKQEAYAAPEIDGFIHNRIVVGCSFLKIYRKQWNEWIDKRIPQKNAKGETSKYNIKTEKVEFEKGVIENIPDIDDILMPEYGKSIQELPYFIQILHLDGESVLAALDGKVFIPRDVEEYKKKLYAHAFAEKERTLGTEKLKELGITADAMGDTDVRRLTINIYEWYGMYTKDGRTEKYRVHRDLVCDEILSLKPLRKINRSGKIPFVGGSLYKDPGQIRGHSLMKVIAPIVNAINNVYCQKSDFQYVENCPFGFHNPDEGYTQQVYELEPMKSFPVSGKPSESVYFPNLSRSMAWAEADIRILLEVLERLTGAASYFMSRANQSKTLGQDQLIDRNSETRFGLWVERVQQDISEAIGMWFELYQDYPPKGLAERVINEDGKKLFPNLSVHTLRGQSSVQITPDVVAGSKQYRRQLQLWMFQTAQQIIWLDPRMNPQGNWDLTADTFREILSLSDNDIRRYLGERPRDNFDRAELDEEWHRFMDGEDFDPPEGATALAMEHLQGHLKQKEEKLHLMDEEYRPVFEAHIFKTTINAMKFMREVQQDKAAEGFASKMVLNKEFGLGGPQQVMPGAMPGQGGMPGAMPGVMPGGMPGGMPNA